MISASDLGPGLALLGLGGLPLALASRSPRRRELLQRLRIPLLLLDVDAREGNWNGEEPPPDYARRLAREKLEAALPEAGERGAYACLAADTIVVVDGQVLEKPESRDHAAQLLGTISGRWHEVWTGIALGRLGDGRIVTDRECSRVYFDELRPEDRERYLDTGEPMDKAGAYGIQGWGGIFVPRIEGDYFNVMGLPLAALRRLCGRLESPGWGSA
jgi:septum formation protein